MVAGARGIGEKIKLAEQLRGEFEGEFRDRLLTLVSAALGVVAALFWQTAIMDTIKAFMPVSGAWQYELLVALVVTLLAATALFVISKTARKK